MNREARILEKTYKDSLTVYRKEVKKAANGGSTLVDKAVYNSLPCGLSRGIEDAPERDSIVGRSSIEYHIFTSPEIEMLENDTAVVTTSSGQIYRGTTSRTHKYSSHGETVLRADKKS